MADNMTHQDSDDHRVVENGEVVVKADTEERQAVEVKPMRYVLGIGLAAVIIGMAISYISFT
ncbi:hypothetical protein [Ancylobacter gelatini]|uniref:hypothetical protein n=1 Tax=Ancylobacter TaxID=99 RepID=UPI001F4D42FF|nr:hypothetical protein [Ancylobacter gelatini]MCJ8141482.1 hypothetical protein [Ancylobacter gelatini]